MRKVKYWLFNKGQRTDGEGFFHQWAQSFDEFESGPGNWTYALIENPDGTMAQVDPGCIQFLDKLQEDETVQTSLLSRCGSL